MIFEALRPPGPVTAIAVTPGWMPRLFLVGPVEIQQSHRGELDDE